MTDVKPASGKAESSQALDHVIRVGLVAYGVIHILIGWLAVQIAFGERAKQASGTGALEYLARQPLGGVLIWVVAIGMAALVIWRLLEAWQAFRIEDGSDRATGVVGQLFKGVVYAVLVLSALQVAVGQSGGGSSTGSLTADLMKVTAGRLLVGAVGVGVLAYGAYYVYQGWSEKFLEKLDGRPQNPDVGKAYRWLGRAGFVAKGIAIGLIGGLFIYAAAADRSRPGTPGDRAAALRTGPADPRRGGDRLLRAVRVRPGPALRAGWVIPRGAGQALPLNHSSSQTSFLTAATAASTSAGEVTMLGPSRR